MSEKEEYLDWRGASALFAYNPETGVIIWRKTNSPRLKPGSDACRPDARGYLRVRIGPDVYFAHRLAWLLFFGQWPDGHIDHINHDKSDNRLKNLRLTTLSQNAKNRSPQKGKELNLFGVWWIEETEKWVATITSEGKQYYLGQFTDFFDAACARKSAEIEFNFHPNHGKSQEVITKSELSTELVI